MLGLFWEVGLVEAVQLRHLVPEPRPLLEKSQKQQELEGHPLHLVVVRALVAELSEEALLDAVSKVRLLRRQSSLPQIWQ